MIEQVNVFGLKVSNFEMKDVDRLFDDSIKSNDSIVIFGHSLGYITLFKKFPELYPIINSFDLLVCDGTQFNWYCMFYGFKLKTVISIPNITNFTLEYANSLGLKVLLFGAKEEINKKATENLQKKYPKIKMLIGINGYFTENNESEIISRIREQTPQVVLIGISTPIKEKFVYKYKNDLNANIIIPCGGMIDVYACYTKQSPDWVKKIGLATPYRVLQEPKRLFSLHTWMSFEILFKLIPITFFNRFILRKKNFSLINEYLK